MKLIVPIAFFFIAVAAGSTVLFVSALKPTSTGTFVGFVAWLISPYAVMSAVLIFFQRKGGVSFHWHVAAAIVSIVGILFLSNVIFWHPDAQGAIAVLMTPILQGGALVFILPAAWWMSRNSRA